MKSTMISVCIGSVAVLRSHASAFAKGEAELAPQETRIPVIQVAGLRDADEKPYRKIFKGMQVFEENHQLAPLASLRFKLYPRARNASFDGLVVRLSGDKTDIAVKLDQDQSFILPNSADAANDDAVLTTNKKKGTYAWRVDIRTPGLPPNTRRLGDLRLECKVDMKGAELRKIIRNPSIMAVVALGDPCTFRTFQNPFFADYPVFNVTLVSGTRRESIGIEWLYANSARPMPEAMYELADWRYTRDRQYVPPIFDNRWPDDTLLEFEYMDDRHNREKAAAATSPISAETERRQ